MKFMKLGSKPDAFQNDGNNNTRHVESELASDIVINVGHVKFYLHKFPLLSKCALLRNLVSASKDGNNNEPRIPDIPGGPAAFELCAKFCYGMMVTLNAHNALSTRCAAEYLGMQETMEKGNLVFKIDVFITSTIFRSWKDSIILLQSTTSLLPMAEDLKVVSRCIDSIASKASVSTSKVDWAFTYTRNKKRLEENLHHVPKDWWVEDLCELDIELFERVIMSIIVPNEVIGDALKAYALKKLPGKSDSRIQCGDAKKRTLNTLVSLLPDEKHSLSCSFLLKLLKAVNLTDSGERAKRKLVKQIGQQLEEATVSDLLIKLPVGVYDVETVKSIVKEFIMHAHHKDEIERQDQGILSDASELMVAKVIDGYLAEIAKDSNLPVLDFVELAEMVLGFSRPTHDGLYRAIDTYLKDHPGITKTEGKRLCRLMDCKKLSPDACMHAAQNERLPLRVVVQVLFFEQIRASSSSGTSTPKCIISGGSNGSSRSATTNTDQEDWDAITTAQELQALKLEVASLRSGVDTSKMKSLVTSKKIFRRLWSNKGRQGENTGSLNSRYSIP